MIYRATKIEHVATPPFAITLRCLDIGRATLEDGSVVYCSWGANIETVDPEYTGDYVTNPSWRSNYLEFILPSHHVAALAPILEPAHA